MSEPNRRPHPGYVWSQDYDLLLSLIRKGRIFGMCLYKKDCIDPVAFSYWPTDYCRYTASARGITYFSGDVDEERGRGVEAAETEFKALCAKYKARFLVPESIV